MPWDDALARERYGSPKGPAPRKATEIRTEALKQAVARAQQAVFEEYQEASLQARSRQVMTLQAAQAQQDLIAEYEYQRRVAQAQAAANFGDTGGYGGNFGGGGFTATVRIDTVTVAAPDPGPPLHWAVRDLILE
jgi:hypothetical protein